MNRTIKNIISCVIFTVLLVAAIFRCSALLEDKTAKEKYTPFFESETNFDVVLLGTSHMWNSVLPMELWNEYGITSYNWGYSNCTPAETYYLVQDIVKYTSPKVLVLDLYGLIEYEKNYNGKYEDGTIEQQHVQFDQLPLSWNKIEASQDIFDNYDDNLDFLWNFIIYHNRWTELDQSDFAYEPTVEKGAMFLTGHAVYKFEPVTEPVSTTPDTVCYDYFLKILEYCQANDIELICTYLPFPAWEPQQQVALSIGETIESYEGCHYVDMLYQGILNFSTDIYYDGHLNYTGACKATSWLGDYLVKNYQLDDYSANEHWQNDYDAYLDYRIQNLTDQTTLIDHLLLLYGPDLTCSLEIYNDNLSNSELLTAFLYNNGIASQTRIQESDFCAKLTVTSVATSQIVLERHFTYDASAPFDLSTVVIAEE